MTTPASSNPSRTSFGKYLFRVATRAGRLVNQLEASVLHSPMLASVPFGYRRLGMKIVRVILLLAVGSVGFFLAVGVVALWAFAALPIEANDDEPDVFEVSHPQHRFKYPEMYDEHGSLR